MRGVMRPPPLKMHLTALCSGTRTSFLPQEQFEATLTQCVSTNGVRL
jgi:hypothetical protein